MTDNSKAAQLKDEGNKFFAQQDYVQAFTKYSDAITEDATNAILFANRAACSLAMNKYQEAANDAKKATQLNAGYPKAWARLAIAQDALNESAWSVDAWQKALDTLPKQNLSLSELKQKVQYEAGLKAASEPRVITFSGSAGNMPWDCAKALKPELISHGRMNSSAWVILSAYEGRCVLRHLIHTTSLTILPAQDFIGGVRSMKQLKKFQVAGTTGAVGMPDGLVGLTNGILRDKRVFHIDDQQWIAKYNDQVIFEALKFNAWTEGGADFVIQEAHKRLREQGWTAVRQALSTTIRAWIMRGWLGGGLTGAKPVTVEWLSRVLEVLDWGKIAWKNVSRTDRGVIFDSTFIRGVRSLHLNAFMEAYAQKPGPDSKFPLVDLLEEADDILREEHVHTSSPDGEYDPGFISSFYCYPYSQALSMKGFYHVQTAKECLASGNVEEAKDHYLKGGGFYIEAADRLPEDDEEHAWFLNCGVDNLFRCGSKPLRETLPILKRIRLAIPKMKRIWGSSAMSKQGRDQILDRALMIEKEALEMIEKGHFTLDDCMMPQ